MGHKPDQRARRKRRERETKATVRTPRPPPFTARELFDKKRALIERNRTDLDAKLVAAPPKVRLAYERCSEEIERIMRPKRIKPVEATLYPDACRGLTLGDTDVVRLRDLLAHASNGWDVRVTAPLPAGKPLSLQFRFDPHED